ncbi:MAG TPA: AraC family transcriptional regulator [Bryobacteraceae bacterium]|nr:AraC family transcriptional regulator [Bryobacteraceae bacterium]
MPDQGAYGKHLGEAFRAPDSPSLTTRILRKSTLAVTELRCDTPLFGRTDPLPRESAWLIALQLRACPDHDLFFDGRRIRPENFGEGVTTIYDLRRGPVADIRDPFHSMMFYLPRTALDAMASDAGVPRPGDLRHQPGVSFHDPVVRNLLSSLLPLTANPPQANSLFLDHVVLALTAHIASTYAGMEAAPGAVRGGLAPWQKRRAEELMRQHLNADIPLGRLADECRLSLRHFARAFRISTGMPPHRWLLARRIERAKELLRTRELSLVDVAVFCGFADQSHFTRVFTAALGMSPGAWRRMNAVRPA